MQDMISLLSVNLQPSRHDAGKIRVLDLQKIIKIHKFNILGICAHCSLYDYSRLFT